jgi:hypothetical protein
MTITCVRCDTAIASGQRRTVKARQQAVPASADLAGSGRAARHNAPVADERGLSPVAATDTVDARRTDDSQASGLSKR